MTHRLLPNQLARTMALVVFACGCRDPRLLACGQFGRDLQEGELELKRALLAASAKPKDVQREVLKQELGRLRQKLDQPSPVHEIDAARNDYASAIAAASAKLAGPAASAEDPRVVLHELTTKEAMAFRKTMDACSGAR